MSSTEAAHAFVRLHEALHAGTGRESRQRAIAGYRLFHPTADYDETAIEKLKADASVADARDGHLTGERIRAAVPTGARPASGSVVPQVLVKRSGATLRCRDFAKHLHQEAICDAMNGDMQRS